MSDLNRKIDFAIKLLRSIPQDGPIELSYSGGKDSEKQKEQKPKAKAKSPLSPHELYDAKIEGIGQGRQDVLDHPEQFGLQKPAEWSEEDEENLNSIISCLNRSLDGVIDTVEITNVVGEIAWLKSLRPQPHWKPSEEQMVALDGVIVNCKLNEITKYLLVSLYNDLKKL